MIDTPNRTKKKHVQPLAGAGKQMREARETGDKRGTW